MDKVKQAKKAFFKVIEVREKETKFNSTETKVAGEFFKCPSEPEKSTGVC